MASSWRPGCPVGLADLRLVRLTHWGFDGQARPGEIVVHRNSAERILGVFAALFGARFPMEQVRLIDEFGGDDDRSMAANNTSGFNCRFVAGTRRWSQHAYGRAIDVNPVQNPYVTGGDVRPPEGRPYVRRDPAVPGLITSNSPAVAAFARAGWEWGGRWRSPDYQHFSSTGG
jgi:poly-gamma-glutamate synthesis protein (capsule biosynthesis protein)